VERVIAAEGGERMPGPLTAPRLLLLVLVALGVAGMHTTGHASDRHTSRVASHTPAGIDTHPNGADLTFVAMDVVAMDVVILPASGSRFDPSVVCLAILSTVGIAVLIAWALRARRTPSGDGAPVPAVVARFGRGPPQRCLGLILAELSVLRR
jgi:hypothetical protein